MKTLELIVQLEDGDISVEATVEEERDPYGTGDTWHISYEVTIQSVIHLRSGKEWVLSAVDEDKLTDRFIQLYKEH